MIQQLLAEAGVGGVSHALVAVDARGIEAAADWDTLQSGENYVGYDRTENFASPGGAASDTRRVYAVPSRLRLNEWALSGDWTVGKQATVLNKANGRIVYRFHARTFISSWDRQREERPCGFACSSMDSRRALLADLTLTTKETVGLPKQRLYQLIRHPKPIADRQFEIEFLDSGVAAFAFTFG